MYFQISLHQEMKSILQFNVHAMGNLDRTEHVSESSQYVSELYVSERLVSETTYIPGNIAILSSNPAHLRTR